MHGYVNASIHIKIHMQMQAYLPTYMSMYVFIDILMEKCKYIYLHRQTYMNMYVFHIIGICPWTNMPATSHIHAPLHC